MVNARTGRIFCVFLDCTINKCRQ